MTPPLETLSSKIVTHWSNYILWRALPAEESAPIVEFMAAGRGPDSELDKDERYYERLRFSVGLILMSPSFQWR